MSESAKNPKVFISYSHSSPAHEEWVLGLAKDLRAKGVDAIIDVWDLSTGHDINVFMEQMALDQTIDKVIMICDKQYVEKANNRKRGVGIEAEIISEEIYKKSKQEKFIPVFSEVDEEGNPCLPIYCKSRLSINMSDGQTQEGFNQLLRAIYNKPQHEKPEIGKQHDFSTDKTIRPSKFILAKSVYGNIRDGKDNANSLSEYFETFAESMEEFSLDGGKNKLELIIQNITDFLPCRNEIIKAFLLVARRLSDKESIDIIHKFFEKVLPYYDEYRNSPGSAWSNKADNFKFLIHEMFLYMIAAFIKEERFECIASLTEKLYYVPNGRRDDPMITFMEIWQGVHFNARSGMNLREISHRSQLLKDRVETSGFSINEIIQADFVLTIKDESLCEINSELYRRRWYPETHIYVFGGGDLLEIFAKAKSQEYFDKIKVIWKIETPEQLSLLIENASGMQDGQYRWGHALGNTQNLCKFP